MFYHTLQGRTILTVSSYYAPFKVGENVYTNPIVKNVHLDGI